MGFAHGLATGAQVGNSWIANYRDAKLKAGLAQAGNFSPTDVASGEAALQAGLKAKQFQLDQISADDPDFAAKYKQVNDDFAPTISGLEAQRSKGTSQMVQLPGGRRIEQDEAFSPEQMAGLRSEQAAKVYAQQGYPEEAAKSTLIAQGISKNKQDMERSGLELKGLKRKDAQEARWADEDMQYYKLGDPNTPMDEKNKIVESLANKVAPILTSSDDRFKDVTYKGVENDPKDGMHLKIETPDGEGKVPLTMSMIQKGYQMLVQSRDPKEYAKFMQDALQHKETQAGLDRRAEANNKTQLEVGRQNNASNERVAGIRAAAIASRAGGTGLSAEQNQLRREEIADVMDRTDLTSTQKDDEINRINIKYNPKGPQLREPTQKAGLSVGDLEKIHMMTDVPVKGEDPAAGLVRRRDAANRIHPGAGDQLYGPASSQEVRYDAQGNAWVKGPDGKPVRMQ